MHEATLSLAEPSLALTLFGARDQHLRKVRQAFHVETTLREGVLRVTGKAEDVTRAVEALERLREIAEQKGNLSPEEVTHVVQGIGGAEEAPLTAPVDIAHAGRRIVPRSAGQARYVQAIRDNDLVFSVGPAGTGKTYLAVALAVEALKSHQIRKLVLVRPAVEAGERLGFLPGDLQAKINPYLRPLLDALHEMMDYEQVKRYTEQDLIEVAPLAYMRGRTLNEAFIILDEAQNTTVAQMKMFLTRMGAGSKIVVSGDPTQVDLPKGTSSGLNDALVRLKDIKGVAIVKLNKADIVRHRLVQDIVHAYEEGSRRRPSS